MSSSQLPGIVVPEYCPAFAGDERDWGLNPHHTSVALWQPDQSAGQDAVLAAQRWEGYEPSWESSTRGHYRRLRALITLGEMGMQPVYDAAGVRIEVTPSNTDPRLTYYTASIPDVDRLCPAVNGLEFAEGRHGLALAPVTSTSPSGLYPCLERWRALSGAEPYGRPTLLISTHLGAQYHDLSEHVFAGEAITDDIVNALAETAAYLAALQPEKVGGTWQVNNTQEQYNGVLEKVLTARSLLKAMAGDVELSYKWKALLFTRSPQEVERYLRELPERLRAIRVRVAGRAGSPLVAATID